MYVLELLSRDFVLEIRRFGKRFYGGMRKNRFFF